ncbi:hypothetical protein K6U06_22975 [Acidiferrimicrobium sp. IK]|uniref:hypothetical protein n=1 Tax=Acidiferrimicrobium sp. IK TaxID=2871700 RepID=UPI0021CAFA07|nr:hypothetical protein [Acidiferrimicrobium sp. IK]MCU4187244.1 hypothetical protein [Acidiferrimicrobium sp. IK]
MKILVAVKVVPAPGAVRFDEGLNRIVREGVASMVNPLDLLALDVALAGRSCSDGQEVVALTMGPPGIGVLLDEVAGLGVDRVIHLCDGGLAGADTLATSRALAQAMRIEQADVLLCGRSAMDGGTAQTPAQIAEIAGLAFASGVVAMEFGDRYVTVVEETDDGENRRILPTPAVISVEAGCAAGPAAPVARSGSIEVWDIERLGGDPAGYGIRGSRTYVQNVTDIRHVRSGRTAGLDEAIEVINARVAVPLGDVPVVEAFAPESGARPIWMMAESRGDDLHPTSLEGLACARRVAGRLNAQVVAVFLGDSAGTRPDRLIAAGADRVLVGTAAHLEGQPAEVMAAALAPLIEQHQPVAVIAPWSSRGRHYLPRVAARLELGLTGDFVGLDTAPHPAGGGRTDLVWLKPAWCGSAMARVVARTTPALGTLRPGACQPLALDHGRTGTVETVELDESALAAAASVLGAGGQPSHPSAMEGDLASVLLCVGAGVDPRLADRLQRQVETRGWGFGGTAAAVAGGLVASRAEVSLVKRSISPSVFIGVDLEGPRDLDPVRGAGLVVTVGADMVPELADHSDLVVAVGAAELAAALENATAAVASART